MQRNQVESSLISSIGYNEETKLLEVEFKSGGTYQYSDVPLEKYSEMVQAMSIGRYFLQQIKNNYSYNKV